MGEGSMEDKMKEEKKRLRKEMIDKRKEIPIEEVDRKSESIKEKFISFSSYQKANSIMAYLPFQNEVDTMPIIKDAIKKGKKVTVPKTYPKTKTMVPALIVDLENDFAYGNYGVLEPKEDRLFPLEPTEIDLVVVPGVAFDEDGYRLGYGGGYYDRFISKLREDTILAAVSFEEQIVTKVPLDKWDKRLHLIFTEDRVIDVR
ncbi:5-formyltetrahydrofolate cyclo-ligase [Natranaerofaba carboxydovora]|uniref:5-formyltetrahydrofolate cyclo-ligase n=1 Tax=Natranaerofaba carboxydovora TaxID=2742683 RepID=UPI001F1305B9|nr:5-formyltetrahydrofolate cyclo-ligase [Natranaerofaba carboxydovora]UMZ74574.1 5-formyltetrahydrofolate cyclo-ligase [Natranaerofaba carboxydovora]